MPCLTICLFFPPGATALFTLPPAAWAPAASVATTTASHLKINWRELKMIVVALFSWKRIKVMVKRRTRSLRRMLKAQLKCHNPKCRHLVCNSWLLQAQGRVRIAKLHYTFEHLALFSGPGKSAATLVGGDRAKCRLRYTSEVFFSRSTHLASLQDIIPYANIRYLPYLIAMGHGHANLQQPLRKPGRGSIVNKDTYWKTK